MNLLHEILDELFSMFAADAWLASGVVAIVGFAALASRFGSPLLGGGLLLAGCLVLLAGIVLSAAGGKN